MLKQVFITIVLLIIVSGCRRSRYDVDIKDSVNKVSIGRLEEDLFTIPPSEIGSIIPLLRDKYGEFLTLFGYVIHIGDSTSEEWEDNLVLFATDKMNVEVFQEVQERFASIEKIEASLTDAFKYYSYYFKGSVAPKISTFISGFNNSIVVGDSTLAIGLDRYLGKDSKYYPMLGIYTYQARNMIAEKIPSDCMYAWAASSWMLDEDREAGNTLLASMMHEGKLAYFTKCMLPSEQDSLIFGFTGDQLQFCRNNEDQMWEYLIEHDLLFNTDPFTIRKLTGEAPFTTYFTNESPGRAANWLAFRIVEEYMENQRDVSLPELMDNTNYQDILSGARYSPK
jgi:hypothetical protein